MLGRIKKKQAMAQRAAQRPLRSDLLVVCPLCARPVPPAQRDAHHLIPKSQGGVHTVVLHRICHRQIHALFSEKELASAYPSIQALASHEGMARFIRWVQTKPDDFFERTRKSQRLQRH